MLLALALLAPVTASVVAAGTVPERPWPERFFLGQTRGEGRVKVIFSNEHAVHVRGLGRVDPDGTLVLEQRVDEEGKPVRNRAWHLRATPDGRFTGTLSDAIGPVTGEVEGKRFHIRFKGDGGYRIEQWLDLQADPDVLQNHMTVKKFGVTVATLDETIRHVPG